MADPRKKKAPLPPTEEHFLLQVPDHIAARLTALLQQGENAPSDVAVTFSEAVDGKPQGATLCVDGTELPARLCKLPTIVETHKSLDSGATYFKTGQVGQVLVVESDEAALPTEVELPNGLAPPTANIRKRKWRKRPPRDEKALEQAQLELESLVRGRPVSPLRELTEESEEEEVVDGQLRVSIRLPACEQSGAGTSSQSGAGTSGQSGAGTSCSSSAQGASGGPGRGGIGGGTGQEEDGDNLEAELAVEMGRDKTSPLHRRPAEAHAPMQPLMPIASQQPQTGKEVETPAQAQAQQAAAQVRREQLLQRQRQVDVSVGQAREALERINADETRVRAMNVSANPALALKRDEKLKELAAKKQQAEFVIEQLLAKRPELT